MTDKTFVLVLTHEAMRGLSEGDALEIELPVATIRLMLDPDMVEEMNAARLLRIPTDGRKH